MPDELEPESAAQRAAELKALNAAERAGKPFLRIRAHDGGQQIFPLPDANGIGQLTIGRRDSCDIPLEDPKVSREHAVLERVGAQWTFVDDRFSSNGSFIGGSRLIGRHMLKDGDRLCVGDTVMIYRDPTVRDSASTARETSQLQSVPLTPMQRKILVALCRHLIDSALATPATNKQIADEVFLSVDAVKAHLRVLFERFGLDKLPQNEKRARLATTVLKTGVLSPRDF